MKLMNKIILITILGILNASQLYGMQQGQLDGTGQHIVSELKNAYQKFRQAIKAGDINNFSFINWHNTINLYVKDYVEKNNAVVGVPDQTLKKNLNLLLQINTELIDKIKDNIKNPINVELLAKIREINRYKPGSLDPALEESLLGTFEKIDKDIKDTIVPNLTQTNYYVESRNKAKTMLISAFELTRLMTLAMMNYTAALMYMK